MGIEIRRLIAIAPRALLALCVAACMAALLAPVASAESPWWQLTSGSRPASIEPYTARNEVRELTVQAITGTYTLEEPVGVHNEGAKEGTDTTKLPFNAKAGEIRTHLEALYGAGTVRVAETAPHEFQVGFKGAKGDQPVELAATGEATLSTLTRGHADGEIYVTAENLGEQTITGQSAPVRFTDMLPSGLKAVAIAGTQPSVEGEVLRRIALPCELATLSCSLSGTLAPYDQLEMRILVVAQEGASTGESNTVAISGGEAFICREVTPGTGTYADSGCVDKPKGGNFERSPTGAVESASSARAISLSQTPPGFGIEEYALVGEGEGGGPVTQAGAHPFQLTTRITLNQTADPQPVENDTHKPNVNPVALPKDFHFNWPPGLIGNPNAIEHCTDAEFFTTVDGGGANLCPPGSAVGVATATANEPATSGVATVAVPLFNLQPHPGEPARFGFNVTVINTSVVIDTAVRSGGDYGVVVSSNNLTQVAGLLSSSVTVWGVPGDPRHNDQRGWSCLYESRGNPIEAPLLPCTQTATKQGQSTPAFLSMPTSCTGPLPSTVLGDSWSDPLPPSAFPTLAGSSLPALKECDSVPFSPSITTKPETSDASSASGFDVDLHVPQQTTEDPAGRAEGAIKDITVALPQGLDVNPSSADGLQACSQELAGFTGFAEFVPSDRSATFTPTAPKALEEANDLCSGAAKIGTVTIKTPILPDPITGGVYLATQNQNPFGSLIALYILAEDPVSGVVVKLTGETKLTSSGQLISTFKNNPQAPFEDAELHFFAPESSARPNGGERSPLATPDHCGSYTTTSSLLPWAIGTPTATPSSTFNITSGPGGGPCPPATLPFSPSLSAGTSPNTAGTYGQLSTTIERSDGQQALKSVSIHTPAGLSGVLAGVTRCPEAQANAGSCPEGSLIGHSTVTAGVGSTPITVPGGRVYLTEAYKGAPFGLSIVEPVKAGPFDLEHDLSNPANHPACDCLVVRAKIEVDPHTAELTVSTDQIPNIIDGVPVAVRKVNVTIDRQNFTFNPTSCNPLSISGSVTGYEETTHSFSSPFQVQGCANLKFAPKFSVETNAHATKANGTSLKVKLSYPPNALGSYANVAKVKVSLPKQLPSRLTTLNKACVAATFEANPESCPKESAVGHARVTTPVLPEPLEGSAYFVSHANESFPDLTLVLKGYGVTVDLVGSTQIKNGITTTTFKSTPDVPFENFELNLPAGHYSALTANANLCTSKLAMPTEFTAQNSTVIVQSTPISVAGCAKKKPLTNKQKLANALASCRKRFKHSKKRRAACERQERKRYRGKKVAKKKGTKG